MQTFVKKYSIANISNYRMKATISFRSLNLSAVGSNSGKYYMKKKGDNIYLRALIILIIVVIFYIVKRLYK